MTDFLVHLLVWTGLLIALVLVLRRPVALYFGPQAAYALWLLPLLRLVVPPIELPAWLAPVSEAPEAAAFAFVITGDSVTLPPPVSVGSSVDWTAVLLAVWLGGATVFLIRRFALYFRMRDELLADAIPVGSAGGVRLVETPAATSPVAFGVLDKVIALPPGFMAWHDRAARDLALAHELQHHAGHDLLVNFAAQPLFALHWFNPLGWLGWNAMRRDQEAACDARVVACRAHSDRALYATLIAGFAAGPNVALAAPMACPVLGRKSVIHRLRSLTMNDISPRRRLAGRALLAVGVLALPLTASITYAERLQARGIDQAPTPPAPPSAPEAPQAPSAPAAIEVIDLPPGAEGEPVRKVVVVRREVKEGDAPATEEKSVERRTHVIRHGGRGLSPEEHARIREEVRASLKDMHIELDEARSAQRLAMLEMRRNLEGTTSVAVSCSDGKPGTAVTTREGARVMTFCNTQVRAQAVAGIAQARAAIAANRDMDETIRQQVLSALDAEIARMDAEKN